MDERKQVDLGTVYNAAANGFVTTVYADPNTFTGADANANVDADDEIAFRAVDAGLEAPGDATSPAGTVAGSGVKLSLSTFIDGKTKKAWIYLFKRSGNLSPGAGKQFVNYNFNLLSGNYKTTYKLQDGPNPENSTVTTPYYSDHFSDRWLNDQLKITTPGSSGVDILDRAKPSSLPATAGARENTFNDAEGAFIANKSGPVRAIRSYIGANSGPLTQREHIFYERRQDIRTFLRVHAIPGIMDYFDYAPAATGMTYKNNVNTGGVTIDGMPGRRVTPGSLTWESVDGDQGGLSIVHTTQTDIAGFTSSSYYFDDKHAGQRGRGAVHRRRHGVRQQRALDHAGDPEHRSAHRRLQEPARHAHALLRGCRQRRTGRRAARSWPPPSRSLRRPSRNREGCRVRRRRRAPRRPPAARA